MGARLPRQHPGLTPSARVHNTAATELDACSRSITVRRQRSHKELEGNNQVGIAPNVDYTIAWEIVTGGVNKGNWSPGLAPVVNITESGLYVMLLQVRYPVAYSTVDTTGRRWARIMLNGTSPLSDTIGQAVTSATAVRTSGITVQAFACRALQAGDTVWCGFRSSHTNAAVADALSPDLGGTYFTLARMGPGAGALVPDLGGEGSIPRLESRSKPPPEALNLFAQAIDNLGVCTRPRRTSLLSVSANVAQTIAWQVDGLDTRGDMWDPAEPTKLTVRISGQYLLELQVRFPITGGSAAGDRYAAIHLGSTASTAVLARDDRPGSDTYEGATCFVRAIVKLAAGDVLYATCGSTVAVQAAGPSVWPTYLFAARTGRSGSGGSVLEGTGFDPGPVPERAPVVSGDVIAA